MNDFKWHVPNNEDRYSLDTNASHGNTKAHKFDKKTGMSICKRWWIDPNYLEESEEIEEMQSENGLCKKCLGKMEINHET